MIYVLLTGLTIYNLISTLLIGDLEDRVEDLENRLDDHAHFHAAEKMKATIKTIEEGSDHGRLVGTGTGGR